MSDQSIICGNCGTRNDPSSNYCHECGALLAAYASPAGSEPPTESTDSPISTPDVPVEAIPAADPTTASRPADAWPSPVAFANHPAAPPAESAAATEIVAAPAPAPAPALAPSPIPAPTPADLTASPTVPPDVSDHVAPAAPIRVTPEASPLDATASHGFGATGERAAPPALGPQPHRSVPPSPGWDAAPPLGAAASTPPRPAVPSPSLSTPPTPSGMGGSVRPGGRFASVAATPPRTILTVGAVLLLASCVLLGAETPPVLDLLSFCAGPVGLLLLVYGVVMLVTRRPDRRF